MSAVVIPILPSPDFDCTARSYAALGFVERGRWPGEYLIVRRPDGIELHFWAKREVEPSANDVACYIRFDTAAQARALHDEWAALDLAGARLHAPVETDYGLLEFALVDPDGNLLRIGGRLGG
jgi:hypothetical protein